MEVEGVVVVVMVVRRPLEVRVSVEVARAEAEAGVVKSEGFQRIEMPGAQTWLEAKVR